MAANNLTFLQISSLNKVFLDEEYFKLKETDGTYALKGEKVSYQILYTGGDAAVTPCTYDIKHNDGINVSVYNVGNVPCEYPANPDNADGFYLRMTPGLYPDVLYPTENNEIDIAQLICRSLFITVQIPEDATFDKTEVEFTFNVGQNKIKKIFNINVINAVLPKQELTYTQWFHTDCIASYYGYEVYSDKHWNMIEKFVEKAASLGINMILTPIFTLALDTEIGKERPTHQLVDIEYIGGIYKFGFNKLKKWINMCRKYGIEKFEMSHLFTQWGSGCTPKIVAKTENGNEKIFGWHVKADTPEYRQFLKSFLPELTEFLKNENVYDNTYFHISDEPVWDKDFECFKTEREILDGLVPAEKIIDAVSHSEFCDCGLVKNPIVVTSSVDGFFKKGYKNIWAYYCCAPSGRGYSNRFIAMPSGRNRITGFQLYKYNINGFLHWGYNFYYTALSRRKINPFEVTDAGASFQSGDSFTVYPAHNGPIDSLRGVVFYEGLQDNRACKLLEKYIGREEVIKIIEESGEITFNSYPRTDEAVLDIRKRINEKLADVCR